MNQTATACHDGRTGHEALPEPALLIFLGCAGSGKTTLARTWRPQSAVLELDHFRALVCDDAADQDATADAVAALDTVLEARLARGRTTLLDSTNSDRHVRLRHLEAARRHQVPAVAVLFNIPVETCLARNARRTGRDRVPEEALRAQRERIDAARPDLHTEGFARVVTAEALTRPRC